MVAQDDNVGLNTTDSCTKSSGNKYTAGIPKRYIVTAFTFMGFVNMYYLRANLSVAIVEMTTAKFITKGNETVLVQEAEFKWNSKQVGFILSSFAYGALLAPLGGLLAVKLGGATVFGFGVGMTAVLAIITPTVVRLHLYLYLMIRFLEGILESLSMSSYVELLAHWCPPEERSRLFVLAIVGSYFGIACNYPISGYLVKHYGWETIFYVSGAFTLFWYVAWIVVIRNDPSKDKFMSNQEKLFLKEKLRFMTDEKISPPWLKILTSSPVWAYVFNRFVTFWGYAFTALCLPLFIKDVSDTDIKGIGLFTSVPNFCAIISQPVGAYLIDYFRKHKTMSTNTVHKLLVVVGQTFAAAAFLSVAFCSDFIASIVILSVFRLVIGITEASLIVMPVDMAPQFASLVVGISLTFCSLAVILNPTVLGFIVTNHVWSEWSTYFVCAAVLYFAGAVVYFIFGSGKLQPWASIVQKSKIVIH